MQTFAVTVIVLAAASFAAWRLMPRTWRVRLAAALAARAQRHAHLSEDEAATLARKLATGACGSCDSCGTCAPAKPADATAPLHYLPPVPRKPGPTA
ncbi:MAG: DUF6587 family protein [Burkholderiales bacterium]